MNFPELNESYYVCATDQQKGIITINYGNNKIKVINDYGTVGTFGLKRIHEVFMELYEKQKWK